MIHISNSMGKNEFISRFDFDINHADNISYEKEAEELLFLLYTTLPGNTFNEFLTKIGLDNEQQCKLTNELYKIYLDHKKKIYANH